VECNFIDLIIHVRTDNRARLALALPLMGGEYAAACRSAVCIRPIRDCETCSDRIECGWYRVFGQELASDPVALKRHQKPPLPFVFSFPLLELPPATPGIIECGLVVIGAAISCLGMLLDGFYNLLARDIFQAQGQVSQLFSRDYQGTATLLIDGVQPGTAVNLTVLSSTGLLETLPWNTDHCALRLRSPLKLRRAGHQLKRFDFSLFARSVMRRVSALMYYYENIESGQDFKELSRQADAIVCTENDFFFEEGFGFSKQLAGILGQGRFKGDFSGLMPFLVLGVYFHVGKNSSFGFGDFMIHAE